MPKTLYRPEAAVLRQQLRAAREEAGITQTALSDALGRSQTFVSDIERGVRRLDTVELWEICNAMGLDLTAFVAEFQHAIEKGQGKRIKRLRPDKASLPRKRS